MGDHTPAIRVPGKYVGGEGAEVGGGALNHAGDALDACDEAEFSLDHHVQVTDLELHQGGVLEYSPPADAD